MAMTPIPQRAEPLPPAIDAVEPLELTSAELAPGADEEHEPWLQPTEESEAAVADRGAG